MGLSPSPAVSGPRCPTLAPAQLCSWLPPAPLRLGPRPELELQTQQASSSSARSQRRGAGCRGRQEGRGRGGICAWKKGSRLQQPDHQHQGPCVLPQTHTQGYTGIPPRHITPPEQPWCDYTETEEAGPVSTGYAFTLCVHGLQERTTRLPRSSMRRTEATQRGKSSTPVWQL